MVKVYLASLLLLSSLSVFNSHHFRRNSLRIFRMKGIKTFFTPVGKPSSSEKDESTPSSKRAKISHNKATTELESHGSVVTDPSAGTSIEEMSIPSSTQPASDDATPIVNWTPMDTMEATWRQRLVKEYNKPYFQRLVQFLATEARSQTIYPPTDQIFTALNLCPYDQVKVVIIGQDPYHGPGQAHGLAFSVQRGVPPPPSLKNIFTELQADVGIPKPSHGNLEHWSKQGVILLNTALTVRKGDANSHQKKG